MESLWVKTDPRSTFQFQDFLNFPAFFRNVHFFLMFRDLFLKCSMISFESFCDVFEMFFLFGILKFSVNLAECPASGAEKSGSLSVFVCVFFCFCFCFVAFCFL